MAAKDRRKRALVDSDHLSQESAAYRTLWMSRAIRMFFLTLRTPMQFETGSGLSLGAIAVGEKGLAEREGPAEPLITRVLTQVTEFSRKCLGSCPSGSASQFLPVLCRNRSCAYCLLRIAVSALGLLAYLARP